MSRGSIPPRNPNTQRNLKMELPAQFTVEEVISKIEVLLETVNANLESTKKQLKEDSTPEYKKSWFGLYKRVEKYDGWIYFHYCESAIVRIESLKSKLEDKLFALHKFPLDSKVKLSVEEVNELFNREKEHRDED